MPAAQNEKSSATSEVTARDRRRLYVIAAMLAVAAAAGLGWYFFATPRAGSDASAQGVPAAGVAPGGGAGGGKGGKGGGGGDASRPAPVISTST